MTPKTAAQTPQNAPAATATPSSLAAQFAAEQARTLVPAILHTIRRVRQANTAIVLLAMGISYSHQARFLTHLGAGPFAWVVPLAFDLMIYVCIKVTQTRGLAADARRAAITLLVPFVVVSGTVNAVAEIAAAEWLASKIRPDFSAIEQAETEAAPAVEAKRTGRRCEPGCTCRKHVRTRKLTPAEKRRITIENKRAAQELAAMAAGYVPGDAPVSPAPTAA